MLPHDVQVALDAAEQDGARVVRRNSVPCVPDAPCPHAVPCSDAACVHGTPSDATQALLAGAGFSKHHALWIWRSHHPSVSVGRAHVMMGMLADRSESLPTGSLYYALDTQTLFIRAPTACACGEAKAVWSLVGGR